MKPLAIWSRWKTGEVKIPPFNVPHELGDFGYPEQVLQPHEYCQNRRLLVEFMTQLPPDMVNMDQYALFDPDEYEDFVLVLTPLCIASWTVFLAEQNAPEFTWEYSLAPQFRGGNIERFSQLSEYARLLLGLTAEQSCTLFSPFLVTTEYRPEYGEVIEVPVGLQEIPYRAILKAVQNMAEQKAQWWPEIDPEERRPVTV